MMNKNILLFFPNTANKAAISTAIPILGGIAREHGWNISYFDTSFYQKSMDSIEEKETTGGFRAGLTKTRREMLPFERLVPDLQAKIDKFKPDVLAITAMSCDYECLMSFFPQIKIPEETLVTIGGSHSILLPDEIIETGLFDIICIGQGEHVVGEILDCIEEGRSLTNIEGTYFRDRKSGQITRHAKRQLLSPQELWALEEEYSFYDDKYFRHPFDEQTVGMFYMEVARGCPYSCAYCGNSALKRAYRGLGKYVCTRPLDSVFRLLRKMVDEYKIDIFNMTAECFLAHPTAWLKEFAERYSTEIRKGFLIQTRPETVTEENLDILQSCGAPFIQIGMGIESGSERVLFDVCNRRTKVKDIIRAYDLIHEYGFRSNAYFMIGIPTETREEIFDTIDLCRRIKAHVNSVNIFQPFPGQELTEFCIEKGYMTGKEKMETFTSSSVLNMPQISRKEITNLRHTFMLYSKLPKEDYPLIEKCEKDFESNKELFNRLVKKRWECGDSYQKIKI